MPRGAGGERRLPRGADSEVLTAAGPHLEPLLAVQPLADELERFWSDSASRGGESWTGHLDLDEVTLATALVPGGYPGSNA